ncbi:hypothetical protein [Croceibacterium mercuriale]|uniref:hypothetical protein n=1 Tax=Croceibacterium mercuriale TaxID=1572751 RepID=UPI000A60303A|nr:hypothetical protein [Croceibacterium mercuriale]
MSKAKSLRPQPCPGEGMPSIWTPLFVEDGCIHVQQRRTLKPGGHILDYLVERDLHNQPFRELVLVASEDGPAHLMVGKVERT